jgi:hypothetical protein
MTGCPAYLKLVESARRREFPRLSIRISAAGGRLPGRSREFKIHEHNLPELIAVAIRCDD